MTVLHGVRFASPAEWRTSGRCGGPHTHRETRTCETPVPKNGSFTRSAEWLADSVPQRSYHCIVWHAAGLHWTSAPAAVEVQRKCVDSVSVCGAFLGCANAWRRHYMADVQDLCERPQLPSYRSRTRVCTIECKYVPKATISRSKVSKKKCPMTVVLPTQFASTKYECIGCEEQPSSDPVSCSQDQLRCCDLIQQRAHHILRLRARVPRHDHG